MPPCCTAWVTTSVVNSSISTISRPSFSALSSDWLSDGLALNTGNLSVAAGLRISRHRLGIFAAIAIDADPRRVADEHVAGTPFAQVGAFGAVHHLHGRRAFQHAALVVTQRLSRAALNGFGAFKRARHALV